jgi:Ca2+-binding RTX toxin-like protein
VDPDNVINESNESNNISCVVTVVGSATPKTIECIAGRGCIGTDGPDALYGSTASDFMDARQDDDELFGDKGGDFMSGDAFDAPDNDTSTDGDDLLKGQPGFDELVGYGGDDRLSGGPGGDFILAEENSVNEGEDVVNGGRDSDFVLARDGVKDTIYCSGGTMDTVFFDRDGLDTVANSCEFKNRVPEEGLTGAAFSPSGEVDVARVNALRAR